MTQVQKPAYDLEQRTITFAENIIILCKSCPKNAITLPIIDQLIRSGTSVGANYAEACQRALPNILKNRYQHEIIFPFKF